MPLVKHHRELRVFQEGFAAAMWIFELSKHWPTDERYSLSDQIRRSSRAVCANITEAWRKRRYELSFVSKLSDADAESAETQTWLDFALACKYIDPEVHRELFDSYDKICGGLVKMMSEPESWCGPAALRESPAPYDPETENDSFMDHVE
jgi:four helix bundle protein